MRRGWKIVGWRFEPFKAWVLSPMVGWTGFYRTIVSRPTSYAESDGLPRQTGLSIRQTHARSRCRTLFIRSQTGPGSLSDLDMGCDLAVSPAILIEHLHPGVPWDFAQSAPVVYRHMSLQGVDFWYRAMHLSIERGERKSSRGHRSQACCFWCWWRFCLSPRSCFTIFIRSVSTRSAKFTPRRSALDKWPPSKCNGFLAGLQDTLQTIAAAPAVYGHQQVVEVTCSTPSELSNSFEPFRLTQALLMGRSATQHDGTHIIPHSSV